MRPSTETGRTVAGSVATPSRYPRGGAGRARMPSSTIGSWSRAPVLRPVDRGIPSREGARSSGRGRCPRRKDPLHERHSPGPSSLDPSPRLHHHRAAHRDRDHPRHRRAGPRQRVRGQRQGRSQARPGPDPGVQPGARAVQGGHEAFPNRGRRTRGSLEQGTRRGRGRNGQVGGPLSQGPVGEGHLGQRVALSQPLRDRGRGVRHRLGRARQGRGHRRRHHQQRWHGR